MRKCSIVMVAACPFPANHGTPAAIREMSQELARRGHAVRVVTYPVSDAIPIAGVAIDRVRQIGFNRTITVGPSYQRLVYDFLLVFKLLAVVRKHQIEIIHAHNYEAALVAGTVAWLTGLPMIYNAINTMAGELPSFHFIRPQILATGLARLLDYVTPRLADAVIADTSELHQFLLYQGLAIDRVTTIHSGVWPEMFAAGDGQTVRKNFGLGNAPVILYTGTFDEFQGVDNLLQAFQIVRQHTPTAQLLLVGSTIKSSHRDKYAGMAQDLGISGASTITSCSLAELPDFLAAADIAVVPRPESSGIPTKLLNYMAAGKAIVSFAKSATILENGKSGQLVATATPVALAESILDLLANPARAAELGRNARRLAETSFSWSVIVSQIESLYDRLIAQHSRNMRGAFVPRSSQP
jgi:glycosyltransferase involved in cell wall biosynthesis